MKNSKIKKVAIGSVICAMLCQGVALAAPGNTAEGVTATKVQGSDVQPYTMYFYSRELNLSKISTGVKVSVATEAMTYIDHIYHDISIFVNGSLYSSGRYEAWNEQTLDTNINVPASSGDYVDVYVDHYTDHNGIVESRSSSDSLTR